jgi:hypothetical protein
MPADYNVEILPASAGDNAKSGKTPEAVSVVGISAGSGTSSVTAGRKTKWGVVGLIGLGIVGSFGVGLYRLGSPKSSEPASAPASAPVRALPTAVIPSSSTLVPVPVTAPSTVPAKEIAAPNVAPANTESSDTNGKTNQVKEKTTPSVAVNESPKKQSEQRRDFSRANRISVNGSRERDRSKSTTEIRSDAIAPDNTGTGPAAVKAAALRTMKAGKSTFTTGAFDDDGNQATTVDNKPKTATVKKTVIVEDFGAPQ